MRCKVKYDDKKFLTIKPREAKRQEPTEFLIDVPSNQKPFGKRLHDELGKVKVEDNDNAMESTYKKIASPIKVSHGRNVKKLKREESKETNEVTTDQMVIEPDNESITKSKSKDKKKMSEWKHKKIDNVISLTNNKKVNKPAKAQRDFRRWKHDGCNDVDRDFNDKPVEFSSKKRPPILKIFTTKNQRKTTRDPRFEATSGEFDPTIFQAKYGEILKEAKRRDKDELLWERRKEKDPERISQIEYLLKRIDDQEKIEQNDKKKMEIIKKLKDEKRKQLRIAPKTPVFLKKREIKQAQLVEKFKELKASSKLSKYIEKKRKRNVGRERNKMFPVES